MYLQQLTEMVCEGGTICQQKVYQRGTFFVKKLFIKG